MPPILYYPCRLNDPYPTQAMPPTIPHYHHSLPCPLPWSLYHSLPIMAPLPCPLPWSLYHGPLPWPPYHGTPYHGPSTMAPLPWPPYHCTPTMSSATIAPYQPPLQCPLPRSLPWGPYHGTIPWHHIMAPYHPPYHAPSYHGSNAPGREMYSKTNKHSSSALL